MHWLVRRYFNFETFPILPSVTSADNRTKVFSIRNNSIGAPVPKRYDSCHT